MTIRLAAYRKYKYSVYYLKNHTRGKDERIFHYKDNTQISVGFFERVLEEENMLIINCFELTAKKMIVSLIFSTECSIYDMETMYLYRRREALN